MCDQRYSALISFRIMIVVPLLTTIRLMHRVLHQSNNHFLSDNAELVWFIQVGINNNSISGRRP